MKKIILILTLLQSINLFAQYNNTINIRVEMLLKQMTLEEKIGQLNQYSGDVILTGPPTLASDKLKDIENGRVGSVLNIDGAENTRKYQEYAMKSRLRIPLIFAKDVIHGYRTTFPIPLAEAASWDIDAIRKSARIAAIEASASGIQWTFAPMVDICRDPRWGRVMEGSGEDVFLASAIAKARVTGFQGNGIGETNSIIACAKHFAAYGAAQAGRDYHSTDMSERTLWEVYLPPFKAAVDAGVGTIMTGFNDLNGVPATGNKYLLTDVLREKWHYKGIVVSDWAAIGELIPHGFASDRKAAALNAVTAGCDIDMESRCYVDYLPELVKTGIISEQQIDNAVRRILVTKFQLGLFEDPYRYSNTEREKEAFENPMHKQFAKEIAEKSIVLLKNENKTLPIDKKCKRIALIGPLAKSKKDMKGFWSITWDDNELVSVFEGIQNSLPKDVVLTYAKGCDIDTQDKSGFNEAINVAKNADIVIMAIGEAFDMSGEARSRANIDIPGVQEELVKQIKQAVKVPVVALIMAGRPLTFNWIAENANSIAYTWWLGSEAGNAIASVLFGSYNPSAKLPMTIPRSVGQIPIYYNMKSTGRPALNDEDFVYKSAYIDMSNKPLYAFGHGLSYTTFEYSDLSLSSTKMENTDTIIVSYKVKNTGGIDGEEITQLYIKDNFASVTRPTKELKGFEKVKIKSGESKQLEFKIHKEMLSFYNQTMIWQAEPGTFELMIGSSSDKIYLKSNFELINSK